MPSRAEAYGIVFAEAAAFGLPVIATDLGGIPTIVKDNETGFLLKDLNSYNEIIERISNVIDYPENYKLLSKNARNRYEKVLNWDSFAEKLLEIIENQLNRNE